MRTLYKEWDNAERKMFRDWLRGMLNVGEVTVVFVKKDETTRTMLCTTSSELATPYEKKTERTVNEDVCFVFDLEKQAWRSFRYDTLTEVRLQIGKDQNN
jgi:hypothetical protein